MYTRRLNLADSVLRKTEDGIDIMPWQFFLQELWAGNLI